MAIQIDCHGATHIGNHRPANEDQFLIADLNKSMRIFQTSLGLNHQTRLFGGSHGKLMLVADGLGGHESGERASTLAVDGIANYILNAMDWFFRLNEKNEAEFMEELKTSFIHCQEMLDQEAGAIPQRRGMATTLTMAYLVWPTLYVVHVGDTRCYLARGNELKQLTTDHTIGQLARLAAEQTSNDNPQSPDGTPDRAPDRALTDTTLPHNPMNHALWNVIGGSDSAIEPELTRTELQIGDSLLLCSDGLTRYVEDAELSKEITKREPSQTITQRLVDMANDRGGKDNTTVVLAKIFETEFQEAAAEAAEADVPKQLAEPVPKLV